MKKIKHFFYINALIFAFSSFAAAENIANQKLRKQVEKIVKMIDHNYFVNFFSQEEEAAHRLIEILRENTEAKGILKKYPNLDRALNSESLSLIMRRNEVDIAREIEKELEKVNLKIYYHYSWPGDSAGIYGGKSSKGSLVLQYSTSLLGTKIAICPSSINDSKVFLGPNNATDNPSCLFGFYDVSQIVGKMQFK